MTPAPSFPSAPRVLKAGIIALLGMVSLVFVSASAISVLFLFPDSLTLHWSYREFGVLGGVYNYWAALTLQRVAAMALALSEVAVIDSVFASLWQGEVFFRIFNQLVLIALFFYAIRLILPALSRWLALGLVLLAFGAALAGSSALPAFEERPGDHNFLNIWLLDQCNYFSMASMHMLVVALLWVYLRDGFTPARHVLFLGAFAVFLNTHELSLVIGGIVLAAMALASLTLARHPEVPPGIARWRLMRGDAGRSPIGIVLASGLYVVSAAVHLLAPGLSARSETWPAQMPLFPDALTAGAGPGLSPLWSMGSLSEPLLQSLLLAAGLAGFAVRREDGRRLRRRSPVFAVFVLLLLAVLMVTMSGLDAYTGRLMHLPIGKTVLPPHQHLIVALLMTYSAVVVGLLVGVWARGAISRMTFPAWPAWAVIAAGLVLVVQSAAFCDVLGFVAGDKPAYIGYAPMPWPNQFAEFARLDDQLRHPDAAGTAYVDEVTLFGPKHTQMFNTDLYRSFYTSGVPGLVKSYGLSRIVYIPCAFGPNPTLCNGLGKRPEHRSLDFGSMPAFEQSWRTETLVTGDLDAFGMRVAEAPGRGEHYLGGGPFARGDQAAVHVEVELREVANIPKFGLYLTGADGAALQVFDLEAGRVDAHGNFGATVIRPAIETRDDGTRLLRATFVTHGPTHSFDLRLQFVDADGATIYEGHPDRAVRVGRIRMYLVES